METETRMGILTGKGRNNKFDRTESEVAFENN
jgi:hypothetical protein